MRRPARQVLLRRRRRGRRWTPTSSKSQARMRRRAQRRPGGRAPASAPTLPGRFRIGPARRKRGRRQASTRPAAGWRGGHPFAGRPEPALRSASQVGRPDQWSLDARPTDSLSRRPRRPPRWPRLLSWEPTPRRVRSPPVRLRAPRVRLHRPAPQRERRSQRRPPSERRAGQESVKETVLCSTPPAPSHPSPSPPPGRPHRSHHPARRPRPTSRFPQLSRGPSQPPGSHPACPRSCSRGVPAWAETPSARRSAWHPLLPGGTHRRRHPTPWRHRHRPRPTRREARARPTEPRPLSPGSQRASLH